jgi:AraC-like DNA-binding protein
MPQHKHLHWFEHNHGLFKVICHYCVDVDGPEIHSRNAMPWSRLFLVGAHSGGTGSKVTDIAAPAGRRTFPLTPGSVVFMPPGRLLGFDFHADMRMVAFHFRLETIPGHDVFTGAKGCALRSDRRELVAQAYEAIRGDGDLERVMRLRGVLTLLIAEFLKGDLAGLQRRHESHHRFLEVLRHIEANCRADLRSAELAGLMGLSREHFTREFRAQLGKPPKEFIADRLVERACARLLAGEAVGEVAQALGFASPFYFSRFFKARTGVAPSRFDLGRLSPS